jgi:biopolymer transport protein ExbB/TolQ
MSTVPPPTPPATRIVLIDGDMPWRSVFQLTWKFSIASLVIWTVLLIPIIAITATVQRLREAGRTAELQQQIESTKEMINSARRDAERARAEAEARARSLRSPATP